MSKIVRKEKATSDISASDIVDAVPKVMERDDEDVDRRLPRALAT
jgi:hypothetical protein